MKLKLGGLIFGSLSLYICIEEPLLHDKKYIFLSDIGVSGDG